MELQNSLQQCVKPGTAGTPVGEGTEALHMAMTWVQPTKPGKLVQEAEQGWQNGPRNPCQSPGPDPAAQI